MTTFEIHGTMTGGLWWPMGEEASKDVSFTFARKGAPFVAEADTVRWAVEQLMRQEDGDFSTAARISGVLVVIRRTTNRETRRYFDLAAFRSISDYVAIEQVMA